MDFSSDRPHVVAGRRSIRVAHAARIESDDASPLRGEQSHQVAPSIPTLWPAGQQEDRGAVAALHEMEAHAGNRRGPVPKPRPETDRIERRERVRRGRVEDIVGHGEFLVLKEGRSAALP
jgi:hypothetical protein